jgi:hypothetical protein
MHLPACLLLLSSAFAIPLCAQKCTVAAPCLNQRELAKPHDYVLSLRIYAQWCEDGVMLRLLRAGKSARVYPGYDRDPWAGGGQVRAETCGAAPAKPALKAMESA